MNLFWATRQLTKGHEDHLTCFIATALEVDGTFRKAYETVVLEHLANCHGTPQIASVQTQVSYAVQRCRPDMVLVLRDGRRIACEHKIDAAETTQTAADGATVKQIERYLELPDITGVCYFRSALTMIANTVLTHDRYVHPQTAPHFLWRDLYAPLSLATSDVGRWLRVGFEQMGFTPPVPHIGELWPDETPEIKENQRNFGKLWHTTRTRLDAHFKVTSGRRCELYLEPFHGGRVSRVYISPLAQAGGLLRLRLELDDTALVEVHERINTVVPQLPVVPDIVDGQLPNGRFYIDLLASLYMVLGPATDVSHQEERLYEQVVPVLEALLFNVQQSHLAANTKIKASNSEQSQHCHVIRKQ